MYDQSGGRVWQGELDSFGAIQNFKGDAKTDCPFRYQGQYEDAETGLYYNRFRYYSPEEGVYLSQDPIRIEGGFQLYGYVYDVNIFVDIFGLTLRPENGYLRGKRHGISLSDKDAQIMANAENTPHGRWAKKDLTHAGKLADTLEPGGFHDFPVNADSKSVVFHPNGDVDNIVKHPATNYRLRNNGDGTFHGFPIDSTAEPIMGNPAKLKPC